MESVKERVYSVYLVYLLNKVCYKLMKGAKKSWTEMTNISQNLSDPKLRAQNYRVRNVLFINVVFFLYACIVKSLNNLQRPTSET